MGRSIAKIQQPDLSRPLPRRVCFEDGGVAMRFHTYGKYSPELADAVDLQSLLDKLADFLLQSGFAGGDNQSYYGWDPGDDGNKSLEALKQAILDALMESGQFTPEMLEALRGGDD